ncbi:alkaline phosphatase family protein [Chloroflexota bacterium]
MKTLVLWLDAFRKDYLTEKDTPFLFSLAKRFGVGILKPVFGYSSIGASFYTGLYPERHDQLTVYRYGKQPIRDWPLRYLPANLGSLYFNLHRYLRGHDNPVPLVPYRYLKHFSISLKAYYHHPNALPVRTIFDTLRDSGVGFAVYNWPVLASDSTTRLTLRTKSNDKDRTATFLHQSKQEGRVYFMHLWDLDKYGHIYGPGTPELTCKICEQDDLVRQLVGQFSLEEDNILVWSDHGMLNVEMTLDLESKLPPFSVGYLYFLDSTLARFWFFDDRKKEEVMAILKGIEHGHVLSEEEKRQFHINLAHNENGEEIFLADPGVMLLPNFFQKHPVKGMHGYDLSQIDECGIFLANRLLQSKGETVDLMPTIMDMLGIETKELGGQTLFVDKVRDCTS